MIYAGDLPIKYAEPSPDARRLLLVEDEGKGDVQGKLYSVEAQKNWTDLVENYKWIGLAFTADNGMVFGNCSGAEGKANFRRIETLTELVDQAKVLVSKDCLSVPGDALSKSACWPDLNAK
jgi:hypothetical protein